MSIFTTKIRVNAAWYFFLCFYVIGNSIINIASRF